MNVSTLILTSNEEINLPECLDCLHWCDDVIVFDSFSTDRTVEIANNRGARVYQHPFRDYGSQREAARTLVEYKYPWVLTIDADERLDPSLVDEINAVCGNGDIGHSAYRMRRKDHLMGRWIGHATLYPSWFIRLYRNDRIRYTDRAVHEHPEVEGSIGVLHGHLLHYSFNKGLTDWVAKHNRYSQLEAAEAIRSLQNDPLNWVDVMQFTDPLIRRRFLKSLSYRMPLRPALRFAYMYFLRKGFLDGAPGFTYCTLLAIYEYLIVLKMKEMRAGQENRNC